MIKRLIQSTIDSIEEYQIPVVESGGKVRPYRVLGENFDENGLYLVARVLDALEAQGRLNDPRDV
jgi:hypothetical protein